MNHFHGIRRALRIPAFGRRHVEREIDDELAFHIAARAETLRAAGMPTDEALAEATRRFGTLDDVRAECVEVDVIEDRRDAVRQFVDDLRLDLRFAVRSLGHARGFTIVALLTLTLGIASVTSIFSYFNAAYYGTLPYGDASRIVAISERRASSQYYNFSNVSLDVVHALRRPLRSFERVSAYDQRSFTILAGAEPQAIGIIAVDSAFASVFDLRAQLGRLPSPDEIRGGAKVAAISDVLWRSRFGADSSVIGSFLPTSEERYRIIGVLPPGFRFPYQTDAIVPLAERPDSGSTTAETSVSLIGKLRHGATKAAARAELGVVARSLTAIDARVYRGDSLLVRDEMLDRKASQFLPLPSLFLAAGFFLLLIACTNVTNLFYARAANRRAEMAIRASLGAGRGRLIRHALAESLLISAAAAVLGTIGAQWLVRLWLHFVPTRGFPSWFHVAVDWRVLLFAVGVTTLVTLVVGLAPAREGSRFDLVQALKGAGDGGASRAHTTRGSRRGLVVQLGLSMALFISAALLARSFQRLSSVDVGYPAARIAVVQPFLNPPTYANAEQAYAFGREITARAAELPGVEASALRGFFLSLRNASGGQVATPSNERFDLRVIPDRDSSRAIRPSRGATSYVVSDDYFRLLGLHVRQGRLFSSSDQPGAMASVVIGANTAALLWGKAPAVGRVLQLGRYLEPMMVIGVVDDVHDLRGGSRGFSTDPGITVYLSTRQALPGFTKLLARGTGDVSALRARVAALVHTAVPMVLISRETTMASQSDEAFLVTRVFGGVIVALAGAALLLSVIGIYGVVTFGIAQRTREMGIRLALGGTANNVLQLILRETLRFVGVGLVVGIGLAMLLGRLLKAFLFGVSPLDPLTYVVVGILFGAVALVASWLPARRVTRIDPLVALRSE